MLQAPDCVISEPATSGLSLDLDFFTVADAVAFYDQVQAIDLPATLLGALGLPCGVTSIFVAMNAGVPTVEYNATTAPSLACTRR